MHFCSIHNTCPGNEGEDICERGAEELRLLTRVLHRDHVEKLQRLHGRVREVADGGDEVRAAECSTVPLRISI